MDDYVAKPIRSERAGSGAAARPSAQRAAHASREVAGTSLDATAIESLRELGGEAFVAEVIDAFLSDAPALIAALRTTHE